MDKDKLREILSDDLLFAKNFLKIPTKPDESGIVHLVPFVYNPVQVYLSQHKTQRNVVVKPRQVGSSSYFLSRSFRRIYTSRLLKTALLTHKDETTAMLLDRVYGFYDSLPEEAKLELDRSSTHELRFAESQSSIHIETAGAKTAGRSETLTIAHLSEVAHYPPEKTKEIVAGVLEAARAGEVTFESSPKGNSGYFYELYQASKREETPYKVFFFPWWWCPDYKLNRDSELAIPSDRCKLTFSTEEQLLINNFNLTEEQIRWRRAGIADLHELFFQEYPENDRDCWLSVGNMVFDPVAIRRQQLLNIKPPMKEEDFIRYWKLPVGGFKYIIGIDPAQGLPQGDYLVATVVEERSCEQVAVCRTRQNPDLFGEKVKRLESEYNHANCVVETTGGYGDTILKMLEDCPNVFAIDEKKGWKTSPKTRPTMISTLATLLRANDVIIHDDVTLQEIGDFQDIGGKLDVPRGSHDDSLFALMLALVVRQNYPTPGTQRPKPERYTPSKFTQKKLPWFTT